MSWGRWIGGGIALLVAAGVALAWAFLPPAPIPVPELGVTLSTVTLVEPGRGRRLQRTVVVHGDRIAEVRGAPPRTGPEAGPYVLPGLIDMHVHHPTTLGGLDAYFGLLYLAHGVTTVRNTGDFEGLAVQMRADVEAGAYPGPRVFTCGPIVDGDEPLWPESIVANTPEQGRAAVERLVRDGANCVKVYSRIELPVLDAIREAAREAGLPVVGHVPRGVAFESARIDDVQHLIGVPDAHARRARDLTGNEAATDVYPFALGWGDVDEARIAEVVRASREHGVAHTPTLVYFRTVSRWLEQYDEMRQTAAAALLPRLFRDAAWRIPDRFRLGGRITPETGPATAVAFERSLAVVGALHRAGVRLHAGTDTGNPFVVPGASLHEELRLLVRAGLTPEEAWVTATTAPGEFLADPALGRLEPGAPADLLIFDEDPTRDLAALDTLVAVVSRGRYYAKRDLDLAVEHYRSHYHGFAWERVMLPLARVLDD